MKYINKIKTNENKIKYKSSICLRLRIFFSKIFNNKKKLRVDKSKENINTIFCRLDWIILFNESVGKNPPVEIKLMLRFNELKSLMLEILNSKKINKLSKE